MRKQLRRLALLSGLLMLAGCQTTAQTVLGVTDFCDAAEPILYSSRDTEETKRQVREHNAVGVKICDGW